MINYIIQVLLFQALFLAVYDFFLQKETFFKWNRVYLIVTPILSFLIPFLKFESFQNSIPTEYIEQLPTVFLNPEAVILQTVEMESSINYLMIAFHIGMTIFSILFIVKLYNIIKLITTNEVIKKEQFKLVLLNKTASAFSFFNYIFIKKELIEKKELAIIQHELVHCKQLHTLDLLYFEFLKIIMWFNPLVYVYQNRITLLHEYISDAEVVKETDKNSYFNSLLSETFNVENISFTNQFFKQSLIKKRIAMITKNKSQKLKQLKYLLIVPLLVGMLFLSSFEEKNDLNEPYLNPSFEETVLDYFPTINTNNESKEEITTEFISNENKKLVEPNIKDLTLKANQTIDSVIDVPFATIEEVPIFQGCEGTQQELRLCLQENITKHVAENFNSNLANDLGLTPGVKRIFVMFIIDKEGNIVEIKARAQHKSLEEEAIRVVSSLPQMTPGKHEGKVVGVKYSLPIAFKVGNDDEKGDSKSKVENANNEAYGIINLTVTNVNSPIIIQLITESNQIIVSQKISANQILSFKNLPPKVYTARAIIDENNNGKWDTESSLSKSHPEKVQYHNTPIEVRANWEIYQTFSLK